MAISAVRDLPFFPPPPASLQPLWSFSRKLASTSHPLGHSVWGSLRGQHSWRSTFPDPLLPSCFSACIPQHPPESPFPRAYALTQGGGGTCTCLFVQALHHLPGSGKLAAPTLPGFCTQRKSTNDWSGSSPHLRVCEDPLSSRTLLWTPVHLWPVSCNLAPYLFWCCCDLTSSHGHDPDGDLLLWSLDHTYSLQVDFQIAGTFPVFHLGQFTWYEVKFTDFLVSWVFLLFADEEAGQFLRPLIKRRANRCSL